MPTVGHSTNASVGHGLKRVTSEGAKYIFCLNRGYMNSDAGIRFNHLTWWKEDANNENS